MEDKYASNAKHFKNEEAKKDLSGFQSMQNLQSDVAK